MEPAAAETRAKFANSRKCGTPCPKCGLRGRGKAVTGSTERFRRSDHVRGHAAAGTGRGRTPPQPAPAASHGVARAAGGLLDAGAGVLRAQLVELLRPYRSKLCAKWRWGRPQ